MLSILNSISSLTAENALSSTQTNLQKTLTELSTGLKINSGSMTPRASRSRTASRPTSLP